MSIRSTTCENAGQLGRYAAGCAALETIVKSAVVTRITSRTETNRVRAEQESRRY